MPPFSDVISRPLFYSPSEVLMVSCRLNRYSVRQLPGRTFIGEGASEKSLDALFCPRSIAPGFGNKKCKWRNNILNKTLGIIDVRNL